MRPRRVLVSLAIAVLLVALLVYGVGWEAVFRHVGRADPVPLAGAIVAGAGILALRGHLVKRLLRPVDGSATGVAFTSTFLAGYFARSVLPWGRSGGTAITAHLLSTYSDSEFEDNLAVVTTAELFGFAGSIVVALCGVALYAVDPIDDASFEYLGRISAVGVSSLLAIGLVGVLASRGTIRRTGFALAARWEATAAAIPRLPGGDGCFERRVDRLFRMLERVCTARRTVAIAFAIAVCSWLVNALPLYFSLIALGVETPLALTLVCAPIASFGAIVPLPGGTGGIEATLTALLVALSASAISGDVATAATLLYRLSTYWLHVAIGGVGALGLSLLGRRVFRHE